MRVLEGYKASREGTGQSELFAWDTAFYTGLAKARAHNLNAMVVAEYFPLQNCVRGLAFVVQQLFGISMRQINMPAGESWHPDVSKYTLTHPDQGTLGSIYLDLHPRPSKYSHAAHFTLKCGRKCGEASYQKPVVALVCNFPHSSSHGCVLLGHSEVETLFHEFGHALHSLLSTTEFQHLSGTRAALDFVETPSNLMEYFVWDYRVLQHFAHHHGSGEVIPQKMVANLRQSKAMFAGRDIQSQLVFALGDQALFGPNQPLPGGTTSVLAQINDEHSAIKHVPGTHWETRFSHFVGYGAGYYSYLYAKCFAAEIWNKHFSEDPLSAEAGFAIKEKMLRHGGSRDPVLILRDLGCGAGSSGSSGGLQPTVERALQTLNIP